MVKATSSHTTPDAPIHAVDDTLSTADLVTILDTALTLDGIITAFSNQPRFTGTDAGTWLYKLQGQILRDICRAEGRLMGRDPGASEVCALACASEFYLEPDDANLIHAVLQRAYQRNNVDKEAVA